MNAHSPRSSAPTVLVVASGKGGVGASLVSALLALAVSGEGWRVLLVDGTESYGALHFLFGVPPHDPLAAQRDGTGEPAAPIAPMGDTLPLGPAVEPLDELPLSVGERQLVGRISELHDRFDLVVVDAGSRLEAVIAACDAGATHLLVVATEDRLTLAATHALLDAVEARRPGVPVDVVANRATEHDALHVHASLAEAAERFLGRSLRLAGAIPDDPCLRGGLAAGMTVQDAAVGSPAAVAARIAGVLLMTDAREPAARASLALT